MFSIGVSVVVTQPWYHKSSQRHKFRYVYHISRCFPLPSSSSGWTFSTAENSQSRHRNSSTYHFVYNYSTKYNVNIKWIKTDKKRKRTVSHVSNTGWKVSQTLALKHAHGQILRCYVHLTGRSDVYVGQYPPNT